MATNNPSMSVAESNKGLFLALATGPAQVIKGPLLFMVISWLPWEWWLGPCAWRVGARHFLESW